MATRGSKPPRGRFTVAETETLLAGIRADPGHYMPEMLYIRRKDRRVEPFVLNPQQVVVLGMFGDTIARGQLERWICLKARQIGISTLTQAWIFLKAMSTPGSRALTLSYEREHAQVLLRMSHIFLKRMPEWLGLWGEDQKNVVKLNAILCKDGEVSIESEIFIDSATGKEAGHGHTIHYVHASEVSRWPDAGRNTLPGLLQALPMEPETFLMIESTAKNVGDEFNERWDMAEARQEGEEGLILPIFLAWQDFAEYRMDPPPTFKLTEDEREYAKTYECDDAQMYWRRQKIATDFATEPWKFDNAYPASPGLAFQSAGTPAFDQAIISEYRHKAKDVKFRDGELVKALFVPRAKGMLRVFEEPNENHEYLLAVDTAGGGPDGDDSAGAVFDRTAMKFVAEFLCKIDPRLLAHFVYRLGHWYREAVVAVETNNHGIACQNELVEHLRYRFPYRWRRYDNLQNIWTDKIGWETNQRTRPLIIDDMAFSLKQRAIGVPSIRMLSQLQTLDQTGSKVAADDLAMAGLIANHCHMHFPLKSGKMPRAMQIAAPKPESKLAHLDVASREEWERLKRELQLGKLPSQRVFARTQIADVSDAAGPIDDDPWPDIQY